MKKIILLILIIFGLLAISTVSANEMINETDSLMIDVINNEDNNLLTYDVEK